jgi:adenylate kinase family enzyme
LDWFEAEVVPVINYYKGSSCYNMIDINGEQPIADVQKEILAKLGLNI